MRKRVRTAGVNEANLLPAESIYAKRGLKGREGENEKKRECKMERGSERKGGRKYISDVSSQGPGEVGEGFEFGLLLLLPKLLELSAKVVGDGGRPRVLQ